MSEAVACNIVSRGQNRVVHEDGRHVNIIRIIPRDFILDAKSRLVVQATLQRHVLQRSVG